MAEQRNPDKHGRYRVRDRGNKASGSWSSRVYNPATMLLVPGARASDIYGQAMPPKPLLRTNPSTDEPPAPAEDETIEGESHDD